MRTFLTILILFFTFQTWAKADDIRDFEIENMSLYDSALSYFSKKKIKNSEEDYYKDKKYTTATITSPEFKTYQQVQITYKYNDKKFILLDINGIVDKNYQSVLKKLKKYRKISQTCFLIL